MKKVFAVALFSLFVAGCGNQAGLGGNGGGSNDRPVESSGSDCSSQTLDVIRAFGRELAEARVDIASANPTTSRRGARAAVGACDRFTSRHPRGFTCRNPNNGKWFNATDFHEICDGIRRSAAAGT